MLAIALLPLTQAWAQDSLPEATKTAYRLLNQQQDLGQGVDLVYFEATFYTSGDQAREVLLAMRTAMTTDVWSMPVFEASKAVIISGPSLDRDASWLHAQTTSKDEPSHVVVVVFSVNNVVFRTIAVGGVGDLVTVTAMMALEYQIPSTGVPNDPARVTKLMPPLSSLTPGFALVDTQARP